MTTGGHVEALPWPDLDDRPPVIVPVGSTEQHGPHLPTGTDTLVARSLAERVAAAVPGAVVAPAVAYGASGEHEDFPGTISIGHEALRSLLVELGRSATRWTDRVLFLNGHGGNLPTVQHAAVLLRAEGRDVAWVPAAPPGAVPGADAHAGSFETSLLLRLAPGCVRADRTARGVTDPLSRILPRLRAEGIRAVSPSGVLGDPTAATAQAGHDALARLTAALVDLVTRWTPDPGGRLR